MVEHIENTMSDDEIVDNINGYIERTSYNYAVLINGKWGCGKTFFAKNTLIPKIQQLEAVKKKNNAKYSERKVIYISLYGVTSKDEIISQIYMETLPMKKWVTSKIPKHIKAFSGFIKSLAKVGLEKISGMSMPNLKVNINDLIEFDKCIIIFDDLERCSMKINEVFGFINSFVEHSDIKVIIIANEEEINLTNTVLNKELKYLVAGNKEIEMPTQKKENNRTSITDNTSTKELLTIENLNKRVNLLFGEDQLYSQIKEKLIGITINYMPKISETIKKINDNKVKSPIIKSIIEDKQDFIIETMNYYKHYNIRTLLFCIDKFSMIVENIKNKIDEKYRNNIFSDIFENVLVISTIVKAGKELPKWEDGVDMQVISRSPNVFNLAGYVQGFKFVEEFVVKTRFQEKEVLSVIEKYIENKKEQEKVDANDPLLILNKEWKYFDNDEDAKNLILQVNKRLEENYNNYSLSSYMQILYLNITFNRIKIAEVDINRIQSIMMNNLEELKPQRTIDAFGLSFDFDNDDDKRNFNQCLKELNNHIEEIKFKDTMESVNNFLSDKNEWSSKLYEYVLANERIIISQKGFLNKFDIDKLVSTIISSNIKQITDFRRIILKEIYSFSNISEYYKEDIEVTERLIEEVNNYYESIKDKQRIKAMNVKYLINNLNDILKRLKNE